MSAANVAAAILAGGSGSRMGAGVVKGLLPVGGQRIIDRQLAVLRPLFSEVLIAANDPEPWADLGLRVVPDRIVSGPLPRPRGRARERADLASRNARAPRLSQGLPSPADGRGGRNACPLPQTPQTGEGAGRILLPLPSSGEGRGEGRPCER